VNPRDLDALRAAPGLVEQLDVAALVDVLDRCAEERDRLAVVERRVQARLRQELRQVASARNDFPEPDASLDALGQRYLGDAAVKRARKAELLAALRALYPTRSVAMMRRLHPGETLSTAELRTLHPQVKDGDLMGHLAELPPEQVAPYATGDVADTRALRDYYRPLRAATGFTCAVCHPPVIAATAARRFRRTDRTGFSLPSRRYAQNLDRGAGR
jgi:hypothetical protein